MVVTFKDDVSIRGLRPEMAMAHVTVASIFADRGHDCVVTSGVDGAHSYNSRHYAGSALDYRIHHINEVEVVEEIADTIADALPGRDFDVVLEDTHIHVEFDPKREY